MNETEWEEARTMEVENLFKLAKDGARAALELRNLRYAIYNFVDEYMARDEREILVDLALLVSLLKWEADSGPDRDDKFFMSLTDAEVERIREPR